MLDSGGGRPIIQYVYDNLKSIDWADLYIAAADDEIYNCCSKFTDKLIRVPPAKNGTQACHFANREIKADIVINVQTDNVGIKQSTITTLYEYFKYEHPDGIVVGCYEIVAEQAQNPNRVKLIRLHDGRTPYFSRLPIPYNASKYWCHLGVYLFWADHLRHIGTYNFIDHNELASENLEQLFFLNYNIYSVVVEPSLSIDSQNDYEEFLATKSSATTPSSF